MYSRRNVLRGLGATAAGLLLPTRAFSQIGRSWPSLGCADNRVQMIDGDFAMTKYVEKLKAAGVKTVGRFYDREYGKGIGESCYHSPTKVLSKVELAAIEDAGLSVVTIFQHCNADCMNFNVDNPATADKGRRDATATIQLAADLGQPANTPIYFGIDFNPVQYGSCKIPTDRVWLSVETYFKQINEVFARTRWQVGIYGSGRTCRLLKEKKLATYFWLSASLAHEEQNEFFNSGEWHIFQNRIDIQKDYTKKGDEFIDTNVINPSELEGNPNGPYFGQWTTKGPGEPHDINDCYDILASRAFLKKACGYKDASGKLQPQSTRVIYDSTCRVMTEERNGYFGISITEGDEVEGYVHRSDIIGGMWCKMPRYDTSRVCAPPPPKSDVPAISTL